MKKTCYFCINRAFCKLNYAISIFETNCPTGSYFPNDDWLEYERLLKENEQMNKIIDYYDGKPVKDVFMSDGKAYERGV